MECSNATSHVEEKANIVEKEGEVVEPTVLLAYKRNKSGVNNTWYIDTGATNHMCVDKIFFVEIDEPTNVHVIFGDLSKKYGERNR